MDELLARSLLIYGTLRGYYGIPYQFYINIYTEHADEAHQLHLHLRVTFQIY